MNTSKKRSKQQNANTSPSLINFGGGFFISANKFFAVQKEKEKEKEMKVSTDDLKGIDYLMHKYNVEKDELPDGRIKVMLTPKHIDCFGCSKEIEYKGSNLIVWVDKDHYKREARFCRTCSSELNTMGYFNK